MSNLVDHARRELELCGQTAEDPAYAESIIRAVEAFTSYGHSGGSAMTAIEQLHTLLQFGNLSPLTDDPDEWEDRTEISGTPMWQNRRNPTAFSLNSGRTYWLTSEPSVIHVPAMSGRRPCPRCEGCSQLADTDDREPWTYWTSLPTESQLAIHLGLVRPIPCDTCEGTGKERARGPR